MENLEKQARVRAGRLSSKPLSGRLIVTVAKEQFLDNEKF